jgi:hypothetical protein
MNANNQIFVTSVDKMIAKAKRTGSFNMLIPRLYQIIADYLSWIQDLDASGITKYSQHIKPLQSKLTELRQKHPQELCQYKTYVAQCGKVPNISPSGHATSNYTIANLAPTVSGITVDLDTQDVYTFKTSDFTTNYSDPEGQQAYKAIIYFSSLEGTLKFDNTVINGIFELHVKDAHRLSYTRESDQAFSTSFTFRVSDFSPSSKYSNLATNNITGAVTANLPGQIDDHTMTVAPNATTVLTTDMFTSKFTDPENDTLHSIRIDKLNSTNAGVFYLSGVEIYPGMIITYAEIVAGDLYHVAADTDSILSDTFDFSARDTGSMIWVN